MKTQKIKEQEQEHKTDLLKDTGWLRCNDCGFDGRVEFYGYIGRCFCGSYNVIVKMDTNDNNNYKDVQSPGN